MSIWRRGSQDGRYNTYGPAVIDDQAPQETLADAEAALREGDAKRAEANYLRTLGKLGPFAPVDWRSNTAEDDRTRAQCHARLAALAFDHREYDRSLHETAAATAARRAAIAADDSKTDDIDFLVTALVHAATVHDLLGAPDEAEESCRVALELAQFEHLRRPSPASEATLSLAERAAGRFMGAGAVPPRPDPSPQVAAAAAAAAEGQGLPEPAGADVAATALDAEMTTPRKVESEPVATEAVEAEMTEPAPLPPKPVLLVSRQARALPDSELVFGLEVNDGLAALDSDAATPDATTPETATPDTTAPDTTAPEPVLAPAASVAPPADDLIDLTAEPDDVERRSTAGNESAAALMARARGQAMLARFLAKHADPDAKVHAHRAVRSATRARQWAQHGDLAYPDAALTLINALVTRAEALADTSPEVAHNDLLRAQATARGLWRMSPSPAAAAAGALVEARLASAAWHAADEAAAILGIKRIGELVASAERHDLELPPQLRRFVVSLDLLSDWDEVAVLVEALAERLLDGLQDGSYTTEESAVRAASSA